MAILFSLVLLILVLIPIVQNFREKPRDGFPFSYYPMFTNQRAQTTRLTHPIGIKPDGTQIDLNYRLFSGGGMNQARRQLRRLVGSKKGATEHCDRIAHRILESDDERLGDLVQVQIVEDTINIAEFFDGNRKPNRRKIIAKLMVDRNSR